MRALFICSKNRLRSPTAEQVFASWPNVETDSAGLVADAPPLRGYSPAPFTTGSTSNASPVAKKVPPAT
ncbi:hypothetical protein B0G76_3660 [Paraburkholderia sp. BL23I1N1]|nr:hypothetical protein B0G76_3660 [Paraburkholderia sp. BL23I1N1]